MRPGLSANLFQIAFLCLAEVGFSQVPGLEWARTFPSVASPNIIIPSAVAADGSANVYTTGYFRNTRDFDPGLGSFNLTSSGNGDVFVSKLDASGNFVWAVRIGGTNADEGHSIAVDASGNVYVTGSYFGTVDFDPGPLVFNLSGGGAFVLKLNSSGVFAWAKRTGSGEGNWINIDPFGDVVTMGSFTGTDDFDPGAPVLTLTSFGSTDVFVSKLTSSLGDLVWVRQLGGTLADQGSSVDTDASGNVYTTGSFSGTTDFDPGAGSAPRISAGSDDIFISKLSSTGNFVWANRIGGATSERGESISIDPTGNVLTTGSFTGTVDFDPGAGTVNLTTIGTTDMFVSKLDASGLFVWAKGVGSTGIDHGYGITTDGSGNVYYTGDFSGVTDFDPGAGTFSVTPTLDPAAFVSKLDANGNFQWVVDPKGASSGFEAEGLAVALDLTGKILGTGWFNNAVDFDPGVCNENITGTSDDIYIWKLNPLAATSTFCGPKVADFSPTSGPVGTLVTITGTGFNATPANNLVYFGATRATVTGASSTHLTVTVPFGATYEPISVTVAGLTGNSKAPFLVTFPGGGLVNTCSFEAPVFFGNGVGGAGLAIGDLDGDGKTDVVTTDYSDGKIHIFRNTSTLGTISATSFVPSIDYAVGTTPQRAAIADIDGDGKLDIVVASYGSNLMSVFRNISTPGSLTVASFSARVDFPTNVGSAPFGVFCQDLDGDGKTDIAVSNAAHGTISIWQNIGSPGSITSGSFAARLDITGPGTGLTISDLDGDGKSDLVGGYNLSSLIGVSRNVSTPGTLTAASFAPFVNFAVGAWPDYIITGDLDNDNKPDIVTSSWPGNVVSILKNTSSPGTINVGSFASNLDLAGNGEPRGVVITDFDGDGLPDIGLSNQTSKFGIYRNANTPGSITAASFMPAVLFLGIGNARDALSGDIDGDGKPEVITTNFGVQSFSVMRNIVLGGPTITGFSPASGSVGTTVTITGTNFSTTVSQNVVNFNGTAGFVIGATTTSLTVVVPPGAVTGPISVTVNCNGPVASVASFTVIPVVFNTCATVTLNSVTDYIQVATNPSLEPSSITIEALVNFAIPPPFSVIVAKPYQTNVEDSYAIWYQGGNLMAGVRLGAGLAFPWVPTPGQWYHIALTYNSVSNSEILYVDGAPVAAGTALPPLYDSHDFLIGADINNGSHDLFFNGAIDEVRVWNVQRNQVELLTNLSTSLIGNETGLVAYYRINESGQGAGITVPNSATATGTINNGTTVGTATTPVFQGSCTCIPLLERNALIALYNSTGGASWTDQTNWLTPDESTWFGVTVSGCHITNVNLTGNNLVGPLPPEIGDLTELVELTLSFNLLTGGLPASITNLVNLEFLNLDNNGTLTGPLPTNIGDMAALRELVTQGNTFAGPIPPDLVRCTQLSNLQLEGNQHTGSIPPGLGSNSALFSVNLAFNQLTGSIPIELGNLANLTFLSLAGNALTGTIPTQLGLLDELTTLDLSRNQLTGAIPIQLGSLGSLASLQLWNNQLSGTIPTQLGNDTNLQYLGLQQNQLTGSIPSSLGNLTNLQFLELNENQLSGAIPSSLGNDVLLQFMRLSTNQLTGSIPTSFGNFPDLFLLDLDQNLLTGSIPIELGNDVSLQFLNMNNNQLSGSIPIQLGNLVLLEDLNIYNNQLTGSLPKELATCINLTHFAASNNQLSGALPIEYGSWTNLVYFDISNNVNITGAVPIEYLAWTNIAIMYMSGDKLDAIPVFTASSIVEYNVFDNLLDFGDLEPSISVPGTFYYSPQADLPGGSINVNAGNPLTIPFTANGTANLYQWFKNGTPVTGVTTTATFSIASTTVADAGNYTVEVTNTIVPGLTIHSLPFVVTINPGINIIQQPADFIACDGVMATFTTNATGTTNITYQWQFSPNGPPSFSDISNGPNYAGALTNTLTVNTTGAFGVGRYRCRINGDLALEVITFDEGLFVNPLPSPPGTAGNSGCANTGISLTATGGSPSSYRWYAASSGGSPIPGEVNASYVTPGLSVTTTFYASINNGTCESARVGAIATVIPLPAAPSVTPATGCLPSSSVLLRASGGIAGQYKWYTDQFGATLIAGAVNPTYTTPLLSATTTYYVSINNGTCESARVAVTATIASCTPVIETAALTTQVGGAVSIDITKLVTTIGIAVDINSIKVTVQPASGATATVVDGVLQIDYSKVAFSGHDFLTIEVCDVAGHCAQREITIEVTGEIAIYNALSPNGDGMNEIFYLQHINLLAETKNNKVTIFDRWGSIVFSVENYDNVGRVFRGVGDNGSEVPSGTYFYRLDFKNGAASKTGFISLRR